MKDKKKNLVGAKECPAEEIREYVEKLRENNEESPDRIYLSIQSLQRIMNGYVNIIGDGTVALEKVLEDLENSNRYVVGEDTKEKSKGKIGGFLWNPLEVDGKKYPAMEMYIRRDEDGRYEVMYIREHASDTKPEFEWIRKDKDEHSVMICKKDDDERKGVLMSIQDDPYDFKEFDRI